MPDPFVLTHIRRLPLFAACTPAQIEVLADAFQQVKYRAGDTIYRQGENSHALYLFIAGIGQVMRTGADRIDRVQGEIKAGEYVGEASLFSAAPREVSAVAAQDCITLVLTRANLDALQAARPDIAQAIAARGNVSANVPRAPVNTSAAPLAASTQPINSAASGYVPRSIPSRQPNAPTSGTPPDYPQAVGYPQTGMQQPAVSYDPNTQNASQPRYPQAQYPQSGGAQPGYMPSVREAGSNLTSGEVTLFHSRRHPWVLAIKVLRAVILFAVCAGLAILSSRLPASLSFLPLSLCGFGLIVPALMTFYYFMDWRNDYFTITDQRIIHEERSFPLGREQREQLLLGSVQNVNINREGYLAELIGFANLVITTSGGSQPLVLDRMPNPLQAQKIIFDQLQKRGAPGAQNSYAQSQGNKAYTYSGLLPKMRVQDGSRLIYRKHWIVLVGKLWKPLFAYVLLAVLIVLRLAVHNSFVELITPALVFVIIGVWLAINSFWAIWEYLSWRDDVYIVDDETVTDITRLPFGLREARMQAGLRQIQNVTSNITNVWGSVLNEGNVVIQTAAENGSLVFYNVSNPSRIAEEILQRVHRYENR